MIVMYGQCFCHTLKNIFLVSALAFSSFSKHLMLSQYCQNTEALVSLSGNLMRNDSCIAVFDQVVAVQMYSISKILYECARPSLSSLLQTGRLNIFQSMSSWSDTYEMTYNHMVLSIKEKKGMFQK